MNLRQFLSVWLIKKIQRYGPRSVQVLGDTYEISEEVFNPKYYYTSQFMAKNIKVRPEDTVLDMGTGCGIQAITAGKTASKVIAVDINSEAVRFARKNVRTSKLDNVISVVEGDLFSPLDNRYKYDIILFTPPYMEGNPGNNFEHALFDSKKNLMKRFFKEAGEYLKPGGYIQMMYSSIAEPYLTLNIAEQNGWHYRIIAREKTFTEIFLIYKFSLD